MFKDYYAFQNLVFFIYFYHLQHRLFVRFGLHSNLRFGFNSLRMSCCQLSYLREDFFEHFPSLYIVHFLSKFVHLRKMINRAVFASFHCQNIE